ncbi:MAG TPA: AI-2E family transporter [Pleomorphomonadaceae bacterium]|nr:AI-2E family transporter [Pleomorphomonadaceae bacterium]
MEVAVIELFQGAWVRERRLLAIFLVTGTVYFGLLALQSVLQFLGGFQDIIVALFLAWLLAFLISPLVHRVESRLQVGRGAAVGVAFGVTVIALATFLLVVAAVMVGDLADFISTWPAREDQIARQIRDLQQMIGFEEPDLATVFIGFTDQIASLGSALAGSAGSIAGGAFSAIGTLFLVVLLAFFMVLDSHKIMVWLSRLVPGRFREQSILLQEGVARSFGGFIRAQTVFALLMFATVLAVGLLARELGGMEYIFVTAVVSGLFMFIPLIGPALALAPPVFIAFLTSENWFVALAGVAVIVLVQTVMVNVLQPKIMQESLGLHPILLFVGLLVGVQIAGLWGALFGIPILAVIVSFVNHWVDIYSPPEPESEPTAAAVSEGSSPG